MKRAVLDGSQTDDATSNARDTTRWTVREPPSLSNALPFSETRLGSATCQQDCQPQHRGPASKLDLEINEAERILEQCRSKNAKIREFKANLDEVVSVRRRELALIFDRLTQCSGESGSTITTHAGISKLDEQFVTPSASEVHKVVSRLLRLFERQALLEVRYRAKKLHSEKLASFLKSASVDQVYATDAFAKVRPHLVRERARYCQEEVRKNELAKRARERHLHDAHHSHLKQEKNKMGKDVETELLRLKRQSAEKKRARKLDTLRRKRQAQLDAEFECLRAEDQQRRQQQACAAVQPDGELDCIESLLHESTRTHVQLTQSSSRVLATLRVSLSGSPESHEKEAARLVHWLKTVTSVVGIPALSAFEGTEFANKPIKISQDGIISIEFEVNPNIIGSVERAFKFVCPQSSKNITLTIGSCMHSDTNQPLVKEHQPEEGAIYMFAILLDDETSIEAGLNHLVRDDTPLGRVNWLNYVDILQKPRNMMILRAHLDDNFPPDDILHELDKFTTFACRVTDPVTNYARRISLNTVAAVDNTTISFLPEETSIVEDHQDTETLQGNPSDLESEISIDRQEEDQQNISEKPAEDTASEETEDRAGDRRQIAFTVENSVGHDILDVHPTSKPQLLSKDNKSKEESARSLVSSDPSADTRNVRFNVKFTPGQDPCKVAACAFLLECVKKSCEWDLDDVTYAPNPSFPAVLITAILFEGVDKEVVYDALCRELIENPKNLMVTFVDYLYDWDQPTDAIKLLRADLENAVREASLVQERHAETSRSSADCVRDLESSARVANMPAALQSLTTPSSSSSFGTLQKELAFIGLSEYYATLRDLGVTDLLTLANMSQAEIRAVAQKAGMTDDHHIRLFTLAEDFAGGIVDKARRQTSFIDPNTLHRKTESRLRKRYEDAREVTNNLPVEIEGGVERTLSVKKEIDIVEGSDSDNDAGVDCRGELSSVAHEVYSNNGEASYSSRPSLLEQEEAHKAIACRISGDVAYARIENSQESANDSTIENEDCKEHEQKCFSLDQERHDGSSDNDTYANSHLGYEAKKSDDNALLSHTPSRLKEEATDNATVRHFSGEPSSSNELVSDAAAAARTTSESNECASRNAEDGFHCPPSGIRNIEEQDTSSFSIEHLSSTHSPAIIDTVVSDNMDIRMGVARKTDQDSEDTSCIAPAASASLVSLQADLTPMTMARENKESLTADDDAFEVGSRVDVNYRGLGTLYSGTISQINSDGTYTVNYDDGEIESSVPKASIYSTEVTPNSTINFSIGMRVEANYRAMDVYYPGAIAGMHSNGTFEIHYDDGDREDCVDPSMLRPLYNSDRPHDYISDPSMDSFEEIRHGITIHHSREDADAPAPSLESSLRHSEIRAICEHAPSTEDSIDLPGSSANRFVAITTASPELELDTRHKSGPVVTPDSADLRQSQTPSITAFVATDSITQANKSETEPEFEVGTQAVPVDTDHLLGLDVFRRQEDVEVENNTWSENQTGVMADVAPCKISDFTDDSENLDSEHIQLKDPKSLTFSVIRSPLKDIDKVKTFQTWTNRHSEEDETVANKPSLYASAPSASFDNHIVEAGMKRDMQFISDWGTTASNSFKHEQSKILAVENGLIADTNRAYCDCASPSPSGRLEEPEATPGNACSTPHERSPGSTPDIAPEAMPIASATAYEFETTSVTFEKNAQREPAQGLNSKLKEPVHPGTEDNYLESKGMRDSILAVGSNDLFGKDTLDITDSVESGSLLASSSQASTEETEEKVVATEFSQISAGSLGAQPDRKDVSMSLHGGNHEQSHASSAGTLGFSTNFSADDEPDKPHSSGDSVRSVLSDYSQGGETSASGGAK